MKVIKFKIISGIFLSLLFSACGKQTPKQSLDIDINAQMVSTNPCDASAACSKSFSDALVKFKNDGSDEFCDELMKRKDGDLAICEVEIRNPKYENLILSCKNNIMNRLDQLVAKRNEGLRIHADVFSTKEIGLGFKLPTQIQIRDTSKGYLAVEGGVLSLIHI